MTLTPQDIHAQQFHVRLRGFDMAEVDAFLEKVAEEMQGLVEENSHLKDQIVEMKGSLKEYKGQERTFQNAFLSAQKIADDLVERSRQESEERLAQARREAEEIEAAAVSRAQDLERRTHQELQDTWDEIERLQGLRSQVREELRALLERTLSGLDQAFTTPAGPSRPAPAATAAATPPGAAAAAAHRRALATEDRDLYERIELPDELDAALVPGPQPAAIAPEPGLAPEPAVLNGPAVEAEEEGGEALPGLGDLEDEFLFPSRDPLEREPQPVVSLEEEVRRPPAIERPSSLRRGR
ncbi:MAG: DivIVA domain-containing protein [Thermodesulfobacteriota bacterium]